MQVADDLGQRGADDGLIKGFQQQREHQRGEHADERDAVNAAAIPAGGHRGGGLHRVVLSDGQRLNAGGSAASQSIT